MTRFVLAAVLCGLAALTVPAAAQEQQSSYSAPAQPANGFTDPAMTFTAIDGYKKVPIPPPKDPTEFGEVTTVAGFTYHPGKADERDITIQMENFEGDLAGYEMRTENDLRNKIDSVFFKKKVLTTLSNGMPAYFQDITIGSGFSTVKRYQYVWVDGVRGIQLAITARFGEITADQAKAALANASATAYPINRY